MIRPRALRLFRFGSFREKVEFQFPEGPGLFFMTGRNEVEPRLGRNGTGKTTLLVDALTWVIYGKDPKGLRASEVANWSMPKGSWVEFDFEFHHADADSWMTYTVRRTHAPNSWVIDSALGPALDLVDDDTNQLWTMLRLTFDTWLNAVIFAQGEPMFLDMKPGPKAALFSDVMGLDKWIGYSEKASAKKADTEHAINELERAVSRLEGERKGVDLADLDRLVAGWNEARAVRLDKLADEYAAALDDLDAEKEKHAAAREKVDDCEALMRVVLDGGKIEHAAEAAMLIEVNRLGTEYEVAKAALERFDVTFEGGKCPTCGQDVTHVHLADFDSSHDEAVNRAKSAGFNHRRAQEQLAIQRKQADHFTLGRTNGERETRHADAALAACERAVDRCNNTLDAIERDIDKLKAEANPYERVSEKARADAARIEAESRLHADALDTARARSMQLDFWVRGFKEVRLGLINDALEHLAIEVNSCVIAHGLVDWSLIFEVDRETKSGGISRGFNVFIKSPHNERAVPWEAWSGGEAQRLRLAAQEGLANLIRERTGATIALEVFDEPTNGLSSEGIADMLDALSNRAAQERRQIWVIDHHALGYGGFDGTYTVVKDANGSRIEST